jgi:hypothetical protein
LEDSQALLRGSGARPPATHGPWRSLEPDLSRRETWAAHKERQPVLRRDSLAAAILAPDSNPTLLIGCRVQHGRPSSQQHSRPCSCRHVPARLFVLKYRSFYTLLTPHSVARHRLRSRFSSSVVGMILGEVTCAPPRHCAQASGPRPSSADCQTSKHGSEGPTRWTHRLSLHRHPKDPRGPRRYSRHSSCQQRGKGGGWQTVAGNRHMQ